MEGESPTLTGNIKTVKIIFHMILRLNVIKIGPSFSLHFWEFRNKRVTSTAEKETVFGVILVHIFPTFFRIRTEYEEIRTYLSVFSPNAGKCGKNADQNNSEYGHFLRSEALCKISKFHLISLCEHFRVTCSFRRVLGELSHREIR